MKKCSYYNQDVFKEVKIGVFANDITKKNHGEYFNHLLIFELGKGKYILNSSFPGLDAWKVSSDSARRGIKNFSTSVKISPRIFETFLR